MSGPVNFEEMERDPYPVYARLRQESPVCWIDDIQGWMLTRWEECHLVLRSSDLFGPAPQDAIAERVCAGVPIVTADGALHDDLREAVVPPLRPGALKGVVDDMVRPVARARAGALQNQNEAELMESYFEPISVRALGDVLGLQAVSDDSLRRWFFGMVSGLTNLSGDEGAFALSDKTRAEIQRAVMPIIERVTDAPDDSVLSHMVHSGREVENPRTVDELMPTIIIYLTGGMQEPGHGAGATLLGLFTNPGQLERVIADPALIPRAVNEGLRWMSPLGHASRVPREPVELAGTTVSPREKLYVVVAAANRDPARFDHPDTFDLDRPSPNHLAFGGGTHVCVGHFFGRAIGRIALEELLTAFPGIAPNPHKESVVTGWHFRAPRQLHVRLS